MTTHDILALIWRDSLISSIAICVVLALRLPTRRLLGAQAAYLLWVLVPCAVLAAMLPAPEHPLTAALQIAPAVFAATPTIDLAAVPATPTFDAQPWLLAGWIAGAMSLLFVLIWQQRRYLRSLGDLVAADDGALRAQGQGGSPALVGALRPRIVLPHDFDTRFDARERELVLAHERAHLLRGDAQVNALIALLRCLNWFNPLFHFAASRLRIDQELACDALVIARFPEARRPYADAMLKAQLVGEARQELRLPAGCYWPSTHPLKERIAMLKSPILSVRRRVVASAAIAMLALGAGYASWAAQPGNPRDAWAQATVTGLPAANADARIGARIVLAVDGEPVIDTLNVDAASKQLQNGWRFEMSGDELLVSGSSAHQSTTVDQFAATDRYRSRRHAATRSGSSKASHDPSVMERSISTRRSSITARRLVSHILLCSTVRPPRSNRAKRVPMAVSKAYESNLPYESLLGRNRKFQTSRTRISHFPRKMRRLLKTSHFARCIPRSTLPKRSRTALQAR